MPSPTDLVAIAVYMYMIEMGYQSTPTPIVIALTIVVRICYMRIPDDWQRQEHNSQDARLDFIFSYWTFFMSPTLLKLYHLCVFRTRIRYTLPCPHDVFVFYYFLSAPTHRNENVIKHDACICVCHFTDLVILTIFDRTAKIRCILIRPPVSVDNKIHKRRTCCVWRAVFQTWTNNQKTNGRNEYWKKNARIKSLTSNDMTRNELPSTPMLMAIRCIYIFFYVFAPFISIDIFIFIFIRHFGFMYLNCLFGWQLYQWNIRWQPLIYRFLSLYNSVLDVCLHTIFIYDACFFYRYFHIFLWRKRNNWIVYMYVHCVYVLGTRVIDFIFCIA